MAGDIAVGVMIGTTVGAAYRRAFLDAKTRLKNLGDAFEEANKRLTAAGAVRFPRTRGDRPAIRSAGYVQTENLCDPRYVLPTKLVE